MLLSQSQDRRLTPRERISLQVHLAACRGCRNFRRQIAFLRTAMQRYLDRNYP